MLRSLMKVSGFTAISRVLGFLRDILIARYLGSGLLGDAFFSAFRFPNLFRRIFGEGAFNAAFVPMFGRRLEKDGKEEAMRFASNAFSSLSVALLILTAAAIPCMPWIMGVVVPGFKAKVEMAPEVGQYESFDVEINGASDIYFTKPDVGSVSIVRLRFIEANERQFTFSNALRFWQTGNRGDAVPLSAVIQDFDKQEQEKALHGSDVAKGMLMGVSEGSNVDKLLLFDNEQLHIRLPDGHNYGWLEGEVTTRNTFAPEQSLKIYCNDPKTFELTVTLSQITFCYLLFMALVAHLSGVLNTFKIFGIPAAAPILLNVVFLIGLAVFVHWMDSGAPAHVLAWCVAIAGLLQFIMLYGACRKNGYHVRFQKPVIDGSIKKLILLMGPGVLAAGIQQINLLVGGIIASFKQGAISWLYYSDRVYQLPLGMIGIALGVVLLPEVTRLVRRDDHQGASNSMVRGMELGLLITLPAAVAMLIIPEAIITVLFQRGEFTADDAYQTGMALRGFALGLPGYVLIKVLQPGYFARENTRAPMMMAGVTVLVNIFVSLILFKPLGHVGIAIATSISAWVNVFLLARGLRGLVHPRREFYVKTLRIVAASIVMGVLVWVAYAKLLAAWFDAGFWQQCFALGLLVGLGILVYAASVILFKATSIDELKAGFRKG